MRMLRHGQMQHGDAPRASGRAHDDIAKTARARTTRLLPADTVATSASASSVTSVPISRSFTTRPATVFSMPLVSWTPRPHVSVQ